MMHTRCKTAGRRGTAAVEAAVVLVVMAPLLIAIWEVGRLVEVEQVMNNAVREGGRQASTGNASKAQVQQYVVTYLTNNGIPATTDQVTVTDLTNPACTDPTKATQNDQLQVTVTIPFDSVRWILLNKITNTQNLSASSTWESLTDVPITVNTTIPLF